MTLRASASKASAITGVPGSTPRAATTPDAMKDAQASTPMVVRASCRMSCFTSFHPGSRDPCRSGFRFVGPAFELPSYCITEAQSDIARRVPDGSVHHAARPTRRWHVTCQSANTVDELGSRVTKIDNEDERRLPPATIASGDGRHDVA